MLLAFLLTFGLASVAGQCWGRLVLDAAAFSAYPWYVPDGDDWYVAYDADLVERDHYVLYGNYGSAIDNLRRADIVILGDSRAQLGFSRDILARFEAAHGVRVYNLALGYTEPAPLPLAIIRDYDIRPRVFVVNAETGGVAPFFRDTPGYLGKIVLAGGRAGAWKTAFGKVAMDQLDAWIRPLFPYVFASSEHYLLLRSWSTGFWYRNPPLAREGDKPVAQPAGQSLTPPRPDEVQVAQQEVQVAQQVVSELRSRGARVVFTYVPSPNTALAPSQELARRVGVEEIAPSDAGLMYVDGSHLDSSSAERFTERFLEQFGPWYLQDYGARAFDQ